MTDIATEASVQEKPRTAVLFGIISWFFMAIGAWGLVRVGFLLSSGMVPDPITPGLLAWHIVGDLGMIVAGLGLRSRRRMAAIAALVFFTFPLVERLIIGAPMTLSLLLPTALGLGLITAIWKHLRSD